MTFVPDLSIPPGHDRPGAPGGAPGRTVLRAGAALAIGAVLACSGPAIAAQAAPAPTDLPAIRVPLDHAQPAGPSITLHYDLGAPGLARGLVARRAAALRRALTPLR